MHWRDCAARPGSIHRAWPGQRHCIGGHRTCGERSRQFQFQVSSFTPAKRLPQADGVVHAGAGELSVRRRKCGTEYSFFVSRQTQRSKPEGISHKRTVESYWRWQVACRWRRTWAATDGASAACANPQCFAKSARPDENRNFFRRLTSDGKQIVIGRYGQRENLRRMLADDDARIIRSFPESDRVAVEAAGIESFVRPNQRGNLLARSCATPAATGLSRRDQPVRTVVLNRLQAVKDAKRARRQPPSNQFEAASRVSRNESNRHCQRPARLPVDQSPSACTRPLECAQGLIAGGAPFRAATVAGGRPQNSMWKLSTDTSVRPSGANSTDRSMPR